MIGFHPNSLNDRLDDNDICGAMVELCKLPDVNEYFWTPCYVEEGYDTMQHAEAVGRLSIARSLPAAIPRRRQNLLAITHDIGKGVARDPGSNEGDQHEVTERILSDLQDCEAIDPDAALYVQTLIQHEHINDWVIGQNGATLENTLDAINSVADILELEVGDASGAMFNFHNADTRAYTLEARFRNLGGHFVQGLHMFDVIYKPSEKSRSRIARIPEAEARFRQLYAAIVDLGVMTYGETASSYDEK